MGESDGDSAKRMCEPLAPLAALTLTRPNEMSGQQQPQDFGQVVDAYYERIFRGAMSVARDRHLAEEIAQETFVAAFRKFDGFSGRSSVFTWLYRIMLNNYCRHCRRKSLLRRLGFVRSSSNPGQVTHVESGDCSPATELASAERRELVVKAVDGLPTNLRMVVAMHYFDGLDVKEIAEVLNCGLGTVKSRLFNARKRLCRTLERIFRHEQDAAVPRS